MRRPEFNPAWSSETRRVYEHDIQEFWDCSLAPHIWNQYQNQLQTYLALVTRRRKLDILDLGCAQATLALLLAEQGHRVTAVDIRPEFLHYARSRYMHGNIHFVCGDALKLSLESKFDLIFANQFLEHTVFPELLLERVWDWLKPGGQLAASTPNRAYVLNRLPSFSELGDPKRFESKQFFADGDEHFFAYSASELAKTLLVAGFDCAKVHYFETPWISGHMKLRHLHRFCSFKVLRVLDRLTLGIPVFKERVSHQLLVTGCRPEG